MDGELTIQCPEVWPDPVDVSGVPKNFRMRPYSALIEMMVPPEKKNGLYLPDDPRFVDGKIVGNVVGKLSPDVGTVIASGDDCVSPGDLVCVLPYVGKWVDDFSVGEYRAKGRVRFLGIVSPVGEVAEHAPIELDVVMKVERNGESIDVTPVRGNILIERDPVEEQVHGIVLSEGARVKPMWATVVAVGPFVECCEPGDRVVYHSKGLVDYKFYEPFERMALVREDNLHCVYDPNG